MAQITLTAGSKPAFLSKNYFNRDADTAGDLACSSGSSLRHRLYDMDPAALWSSSGSSEGASETITAGLYQGNLQATRSVDFVALLGVNIKNFTIQYSADNGATYNTFSGGNYASGVANLAASYLVLSLASPVDANKVKLTMTHTQTATAEKTVGQIVIGLGTFQTTLDMAQYEPRRVESRKTVQMADGSIAYSSIYRSDASFEFYRAGVGWRYVASSERDSFRAIKNAADPFMFYPEPGEDPDGLYLCRVAPGSFRDPFSSHYKGAGYDISFDLEEVGGG